MSPTWREHAGHFPGPAEERTVTLRAETLGGSVGRMPAAGPQRHPDPSSPSAVRCPVVGRDQGAGVGREPVISAVDGPSSPPLPVRVPHTSWPAKAGGGRGRVVRPAGVAEPVDARAWSIVVLDADGDPVETVTGFSSLDAADAYAELSPDITRWTSVPSRPGPPSHPLAAPTLPASVPTGVRRGRQPRPERTGRALPAPRSGHRVDVAAAVRAPSDGGGRGRSRPRPASGAYPLVAGPSDRVYSGRVESVP